MLQDAANWLASQLAVAAAPIGDVGYLPVASGSTPIDITGEVWVGRTVFAKRDAAQRGPAVERSDSDFLIRASALPDEPQAGDRISLTGAGSGTYELTRIAGEPAWRWSDPTHTTYRVHTKEV